MAMQPPVRDLLRFLQRNPGVRARISAPPNATLLYAGEFFGPAWKELERRKVREPQLASKQLLPEVLGRIPIPTQPVGTLLAWAKSLDDLAPWKDNGFIVWRALSGIYASNAVGAVSFYLGSGIGRGDKVFAATELPVLLRNPAIDATTRDILGYCQRCIQSGQTAINFGFLGA